VRYFFLSVCVLACSSPIPAAAPQFLAGPLAVGIETTQATISWASDLFAEGALVLTPTQGARITATAPGGLNHDIRVTGLTPNTTYNISVTISASGLSTEATLSLTTLPLTSGTFRVLFDAAHGQEAGNADWVIDNGNRFASPDLPQAATDWDGAISSWAFDLFLTNRYQVESVPVGKTITFNTQNDQDLSLFDALVLPEPNRPYSASERSAIINFVEQGGGLLAISDHDGADRDDDGFDAVMILNQLMDPNGVINPNGQSLFGAEIDPVTRSDDPLTNIDGQQGIPVIQGIFGQVKIIGINSGATMTLAAGGPAQAIAWLNDAPRGLTDVIAAVSSFGAGKVFLIGDSSPFEDGTGQAGDLIFDSWNLTNQDNATLFLNAIAFVVGDD
jgi:hypothetical protein